jgi:hypothetical protein
MEAVRSGTSLSPQWVMFRSLADPSRYLAEWKPDSHLFAAKFRQGRIIGG